MLLRGGSIDVVATFEIDQLYQPVFLDKCSAFPRAMLKDSSMEVAGNTSAKNGVMNVGHNVDIVISFCHIFLTSVAGDQREQSNLLVKDDCCLLDLSSIKEGRTPFISTTRVFPLFIYQGNA